MADCHKEETLEFLLEQVSRPALIFCDGVEKELEFKLLAPLLIPGDVIGVHDAGTEFDSKLPKIVKLVDQYDLQSLDIGTGHVGETHTLYWLRGEKE